MYNFSEGLEIPQPPRTVKAKVGDQMVKHKKNRMVGGLVLAAAYTLHKCMHHCMLCGMCVCVYGLQAVHSDHFTMPLPGIFQMDGS